MYNSLDGSALYPLVLRCLLDVKTGGGFEGHPGSSISYGSSCLLGM